jgi:NarL family two-component system response regulator LiaR
MDRSPGTCRVLLVDDDDSLRALTRLMLDAEPDFQVIGDATGGREALDWIDQCDMPGGEMCPDVMLLDLNMPDTNGYEVVERMRAHCESVRIIVWTGEDEQVARERLGAADIDFVQKGNPERLLQAMRDSVAQTAGASASM